MIKIKQLIKDLGGPTAVAKACRVHRTTVHNWLRENKCTPKLIHLTFDEGLDLGDYWDGERSAIRTQETCERSGV